MKIILKIIKYFLEISLLIILALVIGIALTSKTSIAGFRSFVVLSGSMEPALPVGSIVLTYSQANYGLGDVVTFNNSSGQTVTHRIVSNSAPNFRVAGDANSYPDAQLVPQSRIIGKAVFDLPYLGFIAGILHNRLGFLFGTVVPAMLFVVLQLWEIKKEIVKDTEKKVIARMKTASA
jgi:signal peptidase I